MARSRSRRMQGSRCCLENLVLMASERERERERERGKEGGGY
jgi:hypothetical protein